MSKTLLDYFSCIFSYVIDIKNKSIEGNHVPYGEAHNKILSMIDNAQAENEVNEGMVGEIKRLNYDQNYFDMAKFAVIAFTDETLVSSDWIGKSDWAKNLLQKQIYQSTMAGATFFDELDRLRDLVNKEERDTIEVFYYALVLGFEGIYFETPEQLNEMVNNIHTKLDRYDKTYLSHLYASIPDDPGATHFREFSLNRTTFFALYFLFIIIIAISSFWWNASSLGESIEFFLTIYGS